jgi:pantothenate kinase-related protein Tda10
VSIDDFYLTNAQQNALAAANPDNRLLGVRGNAGSHDLALGRDTVQQLKACSSTDSVVAVPRWVGGAKSKGVGFSVVGGVLCAKCPTVCSWRL